MPPVSVSNALRSTAHIDYTLVKVNAFVVSANVTTLTLARIESGQVVTVLILSMTLMITTETLVNVDTVATVLLETNRTRTKVITD